jgi:hypothetical protein
MQCGACKQRDVDGNHDGDVVPCRAKSGDDAGDRRAHVGPVVEHIERELESVVTLADGNPFVALLSEQAPGTFRERLAVELRERLRRAEACARAADEQHARQRSMRHASV